MKTGSLCALLALVRERRLRDAAVGSKTSSIERIRWDFMMDWIPFGCFVPAVGMAAR